MDAIFTALGVILFIFAVAAVGDYFFFVDPADAKKVVRRRRSGKAGAQFILCQDCKKPIERRAELYVVGRLRSGLVPLHQVCARLPGSLAHSPLSGGQVNQPGTLLRRLLVLNSLVLGAGLLVRVGLPQADLTALGGIAVVGNAWLLGLRAMAYLTLERRLP